MDLNSIWFFLIGVLLVGYAILDGFDLGVGVLHLFSKTEKERRINLNAIGPVWDGNEVWLLTGGGALFAAFAKVYATIFSGFYIAIMLLLTAFIFRAVSLEFRSKLASKTWRKIWDWAFGLGSLIPAILLGVAVGNILRGVPITAAGEWAGSFLGLLNPYALLIGVLSLTMFSMHGAVYLTMKTTGALRSKFQKIAGNLWIVLVSLYVIATTATLFVSPFLFKAKFYHSILFWVFFLLLLVSILLLPVFLGSKKWFAAFVASSGTIAGMAALGGLSLFPRLVPSLINLDYSFTIYNAANTPYTLTVMLIIALTGVPIMLAYTGWIYFLFKGKVVLTPNSY